MDLDASLYWLALSLTPGIAARLSGKLLRQFGSPEGVFRASLTEREACPLPAPAAQAIAKQTALRLAEKELAARRHNGSSLLTWEEPQYPKSLLEIYDPPPVLYFRGDLALLSRHCISMVGTRRPTLYGNQIAERLARDLASRGVVIVSGMARGIDSSSHKGALAAPNGKTIGVLGTGIDVVYPKENRKLFAQVEKEGALITEFPLGSHPAPENFPIRNRIVAGVSLGGGVVGGGADSRGPSTARAAVGARRAGLALPAKVTQTPNLAAEQIN